MMSKDEILKKIIIVNEPTKLPYGYFMSEFKTWHSKTYIHCPIHGLFLTTANKLIYEKNGCWKCSKSPKYKSLGKPIDVLLKCEKVHDNRYRYEFTDIDMKNWKIIGECKHGTKSYDITRHMAGHGCERCGYDDMAESNKLTKDEIIFRGKEKHGDKDDYSNISIEYRKGEACLIKGIICIEHTYVFGISSDRYLNDENRSCPECLHNTRSQQKRLGNIKAREKLDNIRKKRNDFFEIIADEDNIDYKDSIIKIRCF